MYYCATENILSRAWENYLKHWKEFKRPVPPAEVINRFRRLESDYRISWEKDKKSKYIPHTANFDDFHKFLLEHLDSIW